MGFRNAATTSPNFRRSCQRRPQRPHFGSLGFTPPLGTSKREASGRSPACRPFGLSSKSSRASGMTRRCTACPTLLAKRHLSENAPSTSRSRSWQLTRRALPHPNQEIRTATRAPGRSLSRICLPMALVSFQLHSLASFCASLTLLHGFCCFERCAPKLHTLTR